MKLRFRSRLWAVIICVALLAATTPAIAAPAPVPTTPVSTLSDKQSQAQKVENEISILDQQLEMIVEQYNAARETLIDTQKKLKATEVDFNDVEGRYQSQKQVFDVRLQALYQNGHFNELEVILGSSSVADLLTRIDFLQKMADRDAQILSQVSSERSQIEQVQANLAMLKEQQVQLEADLTAKQKDIQTQLGQRQKYLASINSEISDILQTQEAARNADQAQLLASIYDQTNSMGISAAPGSAVWDTLKFLGVPYLWGGTTPRGFDCSGLVQYVFARHNVALPRVSYEQAQAGKPVAANDLQPADLVFFGNPIHHVGMYIGGGYFIHAPRTGDVVKISRLSESYYSANFAWARRFAVRNPY